MSNKILELILIWESIKQMKGIGRWGELLLNQRNKLHNNILK